MTTEIEAETNQVGAEPWPNCYLCGTAGVPLHRGLRDHQRTVAGLWDMKQCPKPGCGLAWLDPMPREDEIAKAYSTYYTHAAPAGSPAASPSPAATVQAPAAGRIVRMAIKAGGAYLQGKFGYALGIGPRRIRVLYPLANLFFSILPGGRDFVEGTVCFLPAPKPGDRLLEVGFGDGSMLVQMRQLGWDVMGIEADPVTVENTRAMGLDTRLGDLKSHAFPDASFDAIYAAHVLEHVHDPLSLLQECRRILKPGGVVVMVTPNIDSWGHSRCQGNWMPLHPPRHLMMFSPKTVRPLAEKAGFRGPLARTIGRYAQGFFMFSEIIRQRGGLHGNLLPIAPWITRRANVLHVVENLLLFVNPHAGDELVLIAKK